MAIGLLRVVDRALGRHGGEPAAVPLVGQGGGQAPDAVGGQSAELRAVRTSGGGRFAGQQPETHHVGHPAGDPQLHRPAGVHDARVVEPAEPQLVPRSLCESQQVGALRRQVLLVSWPTHVTPHP